MIIFTHIPKTAGTTLKYILRSNFGINHIDSAKVKRDIYTADDLAFARRIFPDPGAISGHNLVDPTTNIIEPGAEIITVLREPVSRCASHYQDAVLRGNLEIPFSDWIARDENQNLSVKIIAGSDDLEIAKNLLINSYKWVGITERFDDSLKLLQVLLDNPLDLTYKRMITASNNEIKSRLLSDQSSRELLEKHNKLDLELYDFAINEIFLPSLEQHRDRLQAITLPGTIDSSRFYHKYKRSVGYNKFIYRQLIKLLNR